MMANEPNANAAILIGIVLSGLYTRLGQPWSVGIGSLFAAALAAFLLLPPALLLLVGLAVPFVGGAVFGYRRRSFWWAVVAVVAAWFVSAALTAAVDGWDVGPAQDMLSAVFFGVYLAGATLLGGVVGKQLRPARQ
jgi:hypothetical protein